LPSSKRGIAAKLVEFSGIGQGKATGDDTD